MQMSMRHTLFIIILFLCASCADRHASSVMDRAETLFDSHPEESLTLLQTIDTHRLSGEQQHARYGLLYTQACYKNYVPSESDSLIQAAADYYEAYGTETEQFYAYFYLGAVQLELGRLNEASRSLIKANNHSDVIDSHFFKAQVYSHLAKVNSLLHCSDEETYARRAYQEYLLGGYDAYVHNAMLLMAEAKYHAHDFDSCRIWADSALQLSTSLSDTASIHDAYRQKINSALLARSFYEADSLYQLSFGRYQMRASGQDLSRMALIAAHRSDASEAQRLLGMAAKLRTDYNDSVYYYANAYNVYKQLRNYEKQLAYQDSLLIHEDHLLKEASRHTALAAERDYALSMRQKAEFQQQRLLVIAVFSVLVLFFLLCSMYFYIKKQKTQMKLQEERLKNLEIKLAQNKEAIAGGLARLKSSPIFAAVSSCKDHNLNLKADVWEDLAQGFRLYLPAFEKTITDFHPLSETEWKVCMLLKLGFSPSDLSILIGKSPSGISSIRSRLYEKAFHKKGAPTDWDAFIYSI